MASSARVVPAKRQELCTRRVTVTSRRPVAPAVLNRRIASKSAAVQNRHVLLLAVEPFLHLLQHGIKVVHVGGLVQEDGVTAVYVAH
jgi:hypothetical protein